MSVSSEKGRSLEEYVAKLFRKKLGGQVIRDKRSGAGSHQKDDLSDWYETIPFSVEIKNHKVLKLPEWFRKTKHNASARRPPMVIFALDDDVLATLPFESLVDLLLTIQQYEAEVKRLREPIVVKATTTGPADLENLKGKSSEAGSYKLCPGGFLPSPGSKKCLNKACMKCHPKKTKEKK
jgi:hypothetical protein